MRGKHCNLRTQGEFVRITPAGAGKTRPCSICRTRSGDHPRRCGENIVDYFYSFGAAGSPPQVRGKLCCDSVCHTCKRITPAGAGKTLVEHPRLKTNRDHPRRCGENNAIHGKRLNVVGSPPQVRGKPKPTSGTLPASRITPAGAGKTVLCFGAMQPPWDHPRRCGENALTEADYSAMIGSPPQVRGKLYATEGVPLKYRITPAGAGKTKRLAVCLRLPQDHPRRCGEN